MADFWNEYWMFICGGLAIVILVGILIFLRMRRPND